MLPGEEQDKLRDEQGKLRDEYAGLPVLLDEHRREKQQAQAVVNGVKPRVDALREELEELEGKLRNAEIVLVEADEQARRLEQRMATMQARDKAISARLTELEHAMQAAPARPAAAPSTGSTKLLDAAERFGEFSPRDLAAVLKMTPKAVKSALDIHVKEGRIRETGRKVMGQPMYEHVAAAEEREEELAGNHRLVRDFCVAQKEPFTRAAIEEGTDVVGAELEGYLQKLIQRGVIEYAGFDDLELYRYVPPTKMGDAARKDRERSKQISRQESRSNGRSSPVAGTGGGLVIANPDVRALVQSIEAAGGHVETGPRGGHYIVSVPGKKRKIPISSTPSSRRAVLNDRSRIRRELELNI